MFFVDLRITRYQDCCSSVAIKCYSFEKKLWYISSMIRIENHRSSKQLEEAPSEAIIFQVNIQIFS